MDVAEDHMVKSKDELGEDSHEVCENAFNGKYCLEMCANMYYQKERHVSCRDTGKLSQVFFGKARDANPCITRTLTLTATLPGTHFHERESNAPQTTAPYITRHSLSEHR
ncbi:hypothetical protein CDAR_95011 [Caerostris darwini]|uniref:Uncharacterized protein n=1 Tax=Caerostris darwini TaxID=1538125 RepID=A0AAV4PL46_9ARAC|nr:hypothetical protein CDAR_95011 [Caerostris darwini]